MRDMSASCSDLELHDVSETRVSTDSEVLKCTPIESRHSHIQDFLLESKGTHTSYKPTEQSGQSASTLAHRGWRRKWQSIASHCTAFFLVAGAVVALAVLPLVGSSLNYFSDVLPIFGFCEPDGKFNTGLENVSVWSSSKVFQITLGFGSMSFSTAKFIDIIWDIAVGRGVQSILVFILYRICTKHLARIMESSPVSFDIFESVTLRGPSVWASVYLIKDYVTNRGIRAKLAISWMVLAMLYVLIFPTLMSAMTGYSPTALPYIRIPDGSLVEWSSFRLVNYVIYDGWRVGLTGSYFVNAISRSGSDQINPSNHEEANICLFYGEHLESHFLHSDEVQRCLLTAAVSEYARTYGFYGRNHISSTFSPDNSTIFNLTSPTLNVSAFYIEPYNDLFGSVLGHGDAIFGDSQPLDNPSLARFVRIDHPDNRTYDIPYLKKNGLCLQQNTYQWGFSFLLLFVALLLSALWALGMWAMWLDVYYNSRIDAARERDMGSWRAAIDLAEAILGSLGETPHGPDTLGDLIARTKNVGDSEIRRRVKRESGYGNIGYMVLVGPETKINTRSAGLRRWLEKKAFGRWLLSWKGWLIAGLASAIILIMSLLLFEAYRV